MACEPLQGLIGRRCRSAVSLLVCLAVLLPQASGIAAGIAVIYPEIRPRYQVIFDTIVGGIERELGGDARVRVLGEGEESAAVEAWLNMRADDVVLALGRRGLNAVRELPAEVAKVVGAVRVQPGPETAGLWGISLAPAPRSLLAKLRELAPTVTRVSVVYNPENSQWLVDRAQQAAAEFGLELQALPVSDLREAAGRYEQILAAAQGEARDAIWLLQDKATVDDRSILPLILEESWKRDIVLFSSSQVHAKRGALFTMYPDYAAMGESLGAMARQAGAGIPKIEPLHDLKVAANRRTAEHLGLGFSSRQLREFGLVYPQR